MKTISMINPAIVKIQNVQLLKHAPQQTSGCVARSQCITALFLATLSTLGNISSKG